MQKIMFNDRFLLTQAVLEGRKKETRRIIKYPPEVRGKYVGYYHYDRLGCRIELMDEDEFPFTPECYIMPIYKVGEIVAIAQRYSDIYIGLLYDWETYKRNLPAGMSVADFRKKFEGEKGWNNKMFVKPKYMPRRIEITDVRIQCLQEITDDECLLEGIEKEERTDGGYNYIFFDAKRELYIRERTPRDAYARLIDALSGKGTWGSNPYVFVYDFELI